jgi:restriction endonuclease S subunit
MEEAPLDAVANLSSGLYLQSAPDGDIRYIQARHFDSEGRFEPRTPPEVRLEERQAKHLLQPGDVLFAGKGNHHFAALYQPAMGRAVASSIFLVLRVQNQDRVLPEYLAWYLNHPQTQDQLLILSRAATVRSLTMQQMARFPIPLPPVDRQRALLRIDTLRRRESALRRELQALRETHIQNVLIQSLR